MHTIKIQRYEIATLVGPVLSYGNESWALLTIDERMLVSAEICSMRTAA
jgi:hypothetical protein